MKKRESETPEIDADQISALIEQHEGELLEWKDSRILKDPFKLARSMSALANQKGGLILIGIKDDGKIEGLQYKKEHEEHIMNIASENCSPPIRPHFESVFIPEKGTVYVVRITHRKQEPIHGVKAKDGLVYFIRVGSTIREMQPHELDRQRGKGVKIEPYSPSDRGLLLLTEKMVNKVSESREWSLSKAVYFLTGIGATFTAGSIAIFFGAIYGKLGVSPASFPTWAYILVLVWLASGIYLLLTPAIARDTTCAMCRKMFKFVIVGREVLSKRSIDENTEEWKILNSYRCKNCGHEDEETVYEEHDK